MPAPCRATVRVFFDRGACACYRGATRLPRPAGQVRAEGVEPPPMLHRFAASFALAVLLAAAPAGAAAAPPCAGVRFLVDTPIVPGSALPFDAVTVDAAGDATADSGCPAAHARIGVRRGDDVVRVYWPACGPLRS